MPAEYDDWAIYYDVIHQGLPGEAEFYSNAVSRGRGPALELGCGTGRIAIPLAQKRTIFGLDLSLPMLMICREKACLTGGTRGRLHLIQGDMRGFALRERFSTIFMAYRTFMHLLTREEQQACLACVREHLKKNGRLLLNVWAPRSSAITALANEQQARYRLAGRYYFPEEQMTLRHYYLARFHDQSRRLEERHRIEEVNAAGEILTSALLTMERTWFVPEEMKDMLKHAGFAIDAVYGDFYGTPFKNGSTEMILVASPA